MGYVELEGIANRDSLPYRDTYGLQCASSLRTLVRGTFRLVKLCAEYLVSLLEHRLFQISWVLCLDAIVQGFWTPRRSRESYN